MPYSPTQYPRKGRGKGRKGKPGRGRKGNDLKEAIRENEWKGKARKCNCVKWEGKGWKREQGSREHKREYAY